MKRLLTLVLVGGLVLGLVGTANAGKSHVLFEDPVGDTGLGFGPAVGDHPLPGIDQGGFDLVSGEIARAGKALEFKVTSASMPPTGSLPEGAKFLWHFVVNGKRFRLMIKSQDVGKPNLVTQQGTERIGRVDLEGHFRLERCGLVFEVAGLVEQGSCDVLGYEDGYFDPAAKSFSATIPLKHIGATTGSVIQADEELDWDCPICWANQTAETGVVVTVFDSTDPFAEYRVPSK